MPTTRKVPGGYRYGRAGKVYKTRAAAAKQGRATKAPKRKARKKK